MKALKTLLLARSPVFCAMFTGGLTDNRAAALINIDDVDPEAFNELLRY